MNATDAFSVFLLAVFILAQLSSCLLQLVDDERLGKDHPKGNKAEENKVKKVKQGQRIVDAAQVERHTGRKSKASLILHCGRASFQISAHERYPFLAIFNFHPVPFAKCTGSLVSRDWVVSAAHCLGSFWKLR